MDQVEKTAVYFSTLIFILTLPFSLLVCFKSALEYECVMIFRLGFLLPECPKGPGLFFILPCIDEYLVLDMRTVSVDVPPQEALTKDAMTVTVDAVVYYRIIEPLDAVTKVQAYRQSARLLAMTTLRTTLGTRTLADLLSDREGISQSMQAYLDQYADRWGLKVERIEIKTVRLPEQMQRAMAAEAEASRGARAKFIAADGEMKASRALKQAADVINESLGALQLRYLQTLNTISGNYNNTIIFPLPVELLRMFAMGGTSGPGGPGGPSGPSGSRERRGSKDPRGPKGPTATRDPKGPRGPRGARRPRRPRGTRWPKRVKRNFDARKAMGLSVSKTMYKMLS